MARAVFVIGLSLGCMAVALSPMREEEMRRQVASMSVDEALRQLDDKLPPEVATLVEGRRGEGAAPKSKTFLETAGHGVRKITLDKKGVETARIKLNEMVEDTQEKFDKEWVECEASINNGNAILEETAADMSLYNAQNTQAKADHLRAQGSITTLETTADKLVDERDKAKAICDENIAQLKLEIEIMVNDSIILQRILGMIDCPKKAGLVQCNDTTTFEKPELRDQVSKLQSDKVKNLVNDAALIGFASHEGTPTPISRAAFFQQDAKFAQTLKRRQRVLRGRQPDVTGEEMNDGPGPEGESCSLATNPNCGKLEDKFMEIAGEVDSDITVYGMHLEEREHQCVLERENYESQINDLRSRLEGWQTALAEATQRSIQANEGERLKRGQYNELSVQHMSTVSECAENLAGFKSELCALGRIRGELYKMSAVPKFIQDCEVTEWNYGDCSKPCMESPTDPFGNQNLTRDVTTPASLGAKCPPMKLTQICNKIRCPIDCIQTEWSEWSGCSSQCGGGIRERIRSVKRPSRYGGETCGAGSETETCNLQDCDKDCALGPWSKIQEQKCSKACGGGVKISTRPVATPPIGQGACPEPLSYERFRQSECNTEACMPTGKTLVCESLVDVVILLDGSGSLGKKGWAATVAMGQTLVSAFDEVVASGQAQVAVQLFSGPKTFYKWFLCTGRIRGKAPDVTKDCGISWVTELTTNTGHFSQDMKTAGGLIKKLKWPARSTFTSLALGQAQAELNYGREGVPKVVVVITDGMPTNPIKTTQAAAPLKEVARVIWVPVTGGAPKEDRLKDWASTPIEENVVHVDDFKALESPDVVSKIVAEVCPEAH